MNNILIYDGVSANFKSEFFFGEFSFERDLTQEKTSEITIFDVDSKVDVLDIFFLPNFFPYKISGKIVEIENEDNSFKRKLKLVFGADLYTNEIYSSTGFITPNGVVEDNNSPYLSKNNSINEVAITDEFINFNELARKSIIASPKSEDYSIFSFELNNFSQDEHFLRLDDPILANLAVNIADDQFNELKIYLDEDKNQTLIGYLKPDGTFTTDENLAIKPTIHQYESVGLENFSLEYIENKLLGQEYKNEISFTIPKKNRLKCLEFNNNFLGRVITIYFPENTTLKSIISYFKVENTNTIDVKLGLARSRLTEILQNET